MLPYQARVFNSALPIARRGGLHHIGGMFALGLVMLFGGFAIEARTAMSFIEHTFGHHEAAS